jgi:HSP20 family protein
MRRALDTGYEVTAELPGVLEKDITVKFSGGTLTITAEKCEAREEKKENYFLSERQFGTFRRSFRVANGVEAGKIEANFENGVLQVTLPKTAEVRKKTKTITIGKG